MGIFDKAKDALSSDKGQEHVSGAVDKGTDAASEKTGGKYDDKIDQAGDGVKDKFGSGSDSSDEDSSKK